MSIFIYKIFYISNVNEKNITNLFPINKIDLTNEVYKYYLNLRDLIRICKNKKEITIFNSMIHVLFNSGFINYIRSS